MDSFEAGALQMWPARLVGVLNSVCIFRQLSERHFQRISSAPYFKALEGTYLYSTIPQLLSPGIQLISLVFCLHVSSLSTLKLGLMLMEGATVGD